MSIEKFYLDRDGTPAEMCKACLTMHVDNFDESTYVWILKKLNLPYIPELWASLRDRTYARYGKLTTTSVIGRYISTMRLNQWRAFNWETSEEAQKYYNTGPGRGTPEPVDPEFEAELKAKLDAGEISEAEYRTFVDTATQAKNDAAAAASEAPSAVPDAETAYYNEENFISQDELPDPAADLTEEDKIYLAMKWGRPYRPDEWVALEQKYNEMTNSFDIQDADTSDTLKLICKVYLKMNQAVDAGDMDDFQKLSRIYDSLRKSAKFTAAQNKEAKNDYVDSVGELVAMCEREGGFIPRFATDIPQDKVDATLEDMNNYVYKLVTQDLGFGQQIDDALKKIQIQKEMDEAADAADANNNGVVELEDADLEDFYDEMEEQVQHDRAIAGGGD